MSDLEKWEKYYPRLYKLFIADSDECKALAVNIEYRDYGYTNNKQVIDFCKELGFKIVKNDEDSMYSAVWY